MTCRCGRRASYTGRGRYACGFCGHTTVIPTITHDYVLVTAAGVYVNGAGKVDAAWAASLEAALQPAT